MNLQKIIGQERRQRIDQLKDEVEQSCVIELLTLESAELKEALTNFKGDIEQFKKRIWEYLPRLKEILTEKVDELKMSNDVMQDYLHETIERFCTKMNTSVSSFRNQSDAMLQTVRSVADRHLCEVDEAMRDAHEKIGKKCRSDIRSNRLMMILLWAAPIALIAEMVLRWTGVI